MRGFSIAFGTIAMREVQRGGSYFSRRRCAHAVIGQTALLVYGQISSRSRWWRSWGRRLAAGTDQCRLPGYHPHPRLPNAIKYLSEAAQQGIAVADTPE
jgi:hypothetical protein